MSASEFFNMAYKAGTAGSEYNDKAHAALMGIIDEIKTWGNLKTGDPIADNAKKVIDEDGSIPIPESEALYNQIQSEIPEYIEAGDGSKEQQLKEAKLKKWHDQLMQFKGIRDQYALDVDNGNISESFLRTPLGQEYSSIIDGNRSLTLNECPDGMECEHANDMGILLTDWDLLSKTEEAMSLLEQEINEMERAMNAGEIENDDESLQALYDKYTDFQRVLDHRPRKWHSLQAIDRMKVPVDQVSKTLLKDTAKMYFDNAMNLPPEMKQPVVREEIKTVVNKILGNATIGSLVHDNMIVDDSNNPRTFYSDLVSHILAEDVGGRKYSDFGVTDDMLGEGDINADGIIDEEEAINIAESITNDEEMVRPILNDYFSNYIENQHNLGDKKRAKSTSEKEREDKGSVGGEREEDDKEKTIERYTKGSLDKE